MNFEELLDKAKQGDEQAVEKLLGLLEEEEPPKEKLWRYGKGPNGAGTFGSERYNQVLDAFLEKAGEGDTPAQYVVGRMFWKWGEWYESNNDVASPKHISWYQESYNWLGRAADKGHAGASYLLGLQVRNELGCSGDQDYALQCFFEAAKGGYKDAFGSLCMIVEEFKEASEDDEDDDDAWERADRANDLFHELFDDGPEEVASWFREAAEEGDRNVLACLQQKALDPSCHKGALRLLVELADAGHEGAQGVLQVLGPEWEDPWEEFEDPMAYLREAANAGSEWGKKSYEAVLAYLLSKAKAGNRQEAETLLDLDAEADGDDGMELKLLKAVREEDAGALRALLDAGVNPNGWGAMALMYAADSGYTEAIKLLLEAHADVNASDNDNGQTVLMYAVQNGDPMMVKALLDAGADVNATSHNGQTALMAAAGRVTMERWEIRWEIRPAGNPEVVKALLEAGADLNAKDQNGKTALDLAEEKGNSEIVEMLRAAGAVNGERKSDEDNEDRCEDDEDDENDDDDSGNECENLMDAAQGGDEETVGRLLSDGADVNFCGTWGRTPLMSAARYNSNPKVLQMLLDAGANINAQDISNKTALMHAVEANDNPEVIQALLVAGADMNAQDKKGNTALKLAEENGNSEIVEMLRAAASGAASADAEDDDAPLCLSKGETLSLFKKAPGLQKLLVGLGWDVNEDGGDFDLDASAFLLGENGKCARVKDVVFYGSLEHPSGAVKHLGDNRTGEGEGDDEQLVVDLAKAPESVTRIVFAVSIHEAGERGQTFGQVENAFIRVVDEASGRELARYEPASEFSDETALVVGELYRDGDDWQFRAVGDGLQGGLAALCGRYGIKTA